MAHEPLAWPLPDYMEAVSTVPAGADVRDLSLEVPQFRGRGVELSEYATLFALRRVLERTWADTPPPPDERIGIGHYRRYAVTRPLGSGTGEYGVIGTSEFAELGRDAFVPPPGSLLLPSIMPVSSVLGQYAVSHVARDLLHFIGLAIDLGVVDGRLAAQVLSEGVLAVVPCTGVYPARWYVQVLADLERVVDAFESTVAVPREGYQRRAVAFCCERLHGMLLAGLVDSWPADRVVSQRAVIVSDDGTYRPNVGRD